MTKAFVKKGIVGIYLLVQTAMAMAVDIKGVVIDKQSGEPLIGAAVLVDGRGAATDMDGRFQISGLKKGTYTVTIQYVAYKTATLQATAADEPEELTIQLEADQQTLGEVKVTGVRRHNTQMAMIAQAKESRLVVNNISAQEIKKTQDNNAGEVIKRIPGVSLIEDKFVMVRGLSQRYNNVWINGGAVPSSEADSRAFSFDIIPSSQIDHLVIVKSPNIRQISVAALSKSIRKIFRQRTVGASSSAATGMMPLCFKISTMPREVVRTSWASIAVSVRIAVDSMRR